MQPTVFLLMFTLMGENSLRATGLLAYDFNYGDLITEWCSHKCTKSDLLFQEMKDQCTDECVDRYNKKKRWSCSKVRAAGVCTDCDSNHTCDDIDICCPGDCGSSCVSPDLSKYEELPPIPTNLTVEVDENTSVVSWNANPSDDTIYLVQERHYIGCNYNSYPQSAWTHNVQNSPVVTPSVVLELKPGYWYEVRVAAINSEGSRGFTEPSQKFKSPKAPNPPKRPKKLKFTPSGFKNGLMVGTFSWTAPQSDLPIKRYTILWSFRLASTHTPMNKGSVQVQRKTISWKKTNFKIRNLDPTKKYFLQVEAQSQCGKRKLNGKKAGLYLTEVNVTTIMKQNPKHQRHFNVWISNVERKNDTVTAKVSWRSRPNVKYAVSWNGDDNSTTKLVVEDSHIELNNLQYQKLYNVTVTEKVRGKKSRHDERKGKVVFVADPDCKKVNRSECV